MTCQKKKTKARGRRPAPACCVRHRTPWPCTDARSGCTTSRQAAGLAGLIAAAPAFSVWEEERASCATAPCVSAYWLLAHYLLGNTDACRETIRRVADAKATATATLAQIVDGLLAGTNGASLGALDGPTLEELRQTVRKNSLPAQLEPQARALSAASTAQAEGCMSEEETDEALSAAADPWQLITEHPRDVKLHDRALALLKKQEAAKHTGSRCTNLYHHIVVYFERRAERNVSPWWRAQEEIDPRFGLVLAAAFSVGLGLDPDHPSAYAGLASTLGGFDDEQVKATLVEAIDRLDHNDRRVDAVLAALDQCRHPRAHELCARVAATRRAEQTAMALAHRKQKQQKKKGEVTSTGRSFRSPGPFQLVGRGERARPRGPVGG
jgi:hypothetical protein